MGALFSGKSRRQERECENEKLGERRGRLEVNIRTNL